MFRECWDAGLTHLLLGILPSLPFWLTENFSHGRGSICPDVQAFRIGSIGLGLLSCGCHGIVAAHASSVARLHRFQNSPSYQWGTPIDKINRPAQNKTILAKSVRVPADVLFRCKLTRGNAAIITVALTVLVLAVALRGLRVRELWQVANVVVLGALSMVAGGTGRFAVRLLRCSGVIVSTRLGFTETADAVSKLRNIWGTASIKALLRSLIFRCYKAPPIWTRSFRSHLQA